MRLKGKIVAVTGASRGLGLAISKTFTAEGASVAMLARNAADLASAAEAAGGLAIVCGVSNPVAVRAGFAQIQARFGSLDVLINNAAVGHPQPIEEAADELVQAEVGVNLLGPLYCMRAAIPMLRARGAGDIVNVTSEAAVDPYPFLGLYAATKSALETLSGAVRSEVSDADIRVAVYRSGMINGTFSEGWDPKMMARARVAAKAAGFYERAGEPITVEAAAENILKLVLLDRSARVDLAEPGGI